MSPTNGLRPDGLTIMPWSRGKSLVWDVTVRDTFAPTYIDRSSTERGCVAKMAEKEKRSKYVTLMDSYIFVPFVIETSGVWGTEALQFTKEIGERIRTLTGEQRATSFLRQRVAIEAARGSALMMMDALPTGDSLHELFDL